MDENNHEKRLMPGIFSFFAGLQWWANKNPKGTPLYISIWMFSAVSTISLAINGVQIGFYPESYKNGMPSYLLVLWFSFFLVFLIFFTRSNAIQKRVKKEETTLPCTVKKSYFPGWALVMAVWCIAWFDGQIAFYSLHHPAGRQFGFFIPENVVFCENFWYQFLGIITSIFVINDIAREKLAMQAESFFEIFITNFFERIKNATTGFVSGLLKSPENKKD